MYNPRRDIILLVKDDDVNPEIIDLEMKGLHKMISGIETIDAFCRIHELITRFKITNRKTKIIKAINEEELKAFNFLINKN